jgi:PhnB protein
LRHQFDVYENFFSALSQLQRTMPGSHDFLSALPGRRARFAKDIRVPHGCPDASGMESNILHSSLSNEHLVLMGSDMIGQGLKPGNAIGLCLQGNSEKEIQTFFKNLSAGGQVKMELHRTFWGATYGELTDKYGFNWMFNLVGTIN